MIPQESLLQLDGQNNIKSQKTFKKEEGEEGEEAPLAVIEPIIHPENVPPSTAQIDIVRYTWERLSEIRLPEDDPNVSSTHAFGLAFYDALFELDPSLQPLFTNIFQQARALAGMVSYIARTPSVTGAQLCRASHSPASTPSIREINAEKRKQSEANNFCELVTSTLKESSEQEEPSDWLLYKFRELGARHYFYKVEPRHLDLIGPAVLKAMKTRLGDEFLPEVAEAWKVAHAYACFHMKIGLEAQTSWEQGRRKSATEKIASNRSSSKNCSIQ